MSPKWNYWLSLQTLPSFRIPTIMSGSSTRLFKSEHTVSFHGVCSSLSPCDQSFTSFLFLKIATHPVLSICHSGLQREMIVNRCYGWQIRHLLNPSPLLLIFPHLSHFPLSPGCICLPGCPLPSLLFQYPTPCNVERVIF